MPAQTARKCPETEPIEVAEVRDLEGFNALASEWNALVAATTDVPFYRHEFLTTWMQSFAGDAQLRILIGRDRNRRLTAALPLLETRGRLRGLNVRELLATANSHSCRFDLLAMAGEAAGVAFLEYLANDPGWDLLRFIDVPDGGQAHHLYRAAQAAGLPTGIWESQRSPYLDLPASEEALKNRLSRQLQSLVKRRRRQLSEKGLLDLERVGDDAVAPALEEFFAIEMRGWKGSRGTACAQDGRTAAFYTRLAETLSRMGGLSLYRLRLDGRTVAFHYGLVYNGTYYLPKLGYDEAYREMSPGLVLMDGVVRDSVARGLDRFDLLGSDDAWKLRWSSGALRHHWLYIFRDSVKGRLLKRLKFDWTDTARRFMWSRS